PVGAIIDMASKHKMAIFAAHTNLDKVTDGLNDILARIIGLNNLKALGESTSESMLAGRQQGLGRIGDLVRETKLSSFALEIKKKIGLNYIKVAGEPDLLIKKAALCTGSGSSLINNFFASGAQVYISGDFRYHDARAAEAANLGIIDISHFASEHLVVEIFARRLREIISKTGIDVKVEACKSEIDPFVLL
ncbi:MAG: Nif3-like dinuclear metal center hexameric protein, partial [Thermodesulfobacteriota bacterium]|nr:Nif3-like dinuclear metal center hexameric protein [Thermodesulfobacteriota bacterium]